jgi:hypothetical protein
MEGVQHMDQLQFLGNTIEQAVVKIESPDRCRKKLLRDLLQMNLYRAGMWPGLDGYALPLRLRYDSKKFLSGL